MITASHNPPQDNGYRLYLADGAQIVPPVDAEISAEIDAVGSASAIPPGSDGIEVLGDDLLQAYLAGAAAMVPPGPRELGTFSPALSGRGAGTRGGGNHRPRLRPHHA